MVVDNIWQEFLKIVNEEVGSRIVETWFKAVTLSQWDAHGKTVYLKAPNTFVKEWVRSNYSQLLQVHLGRLLNEKQVTLIFLDDITSTANITHTVADNKTDSMIAAIALPELAKSIQVAPKAAVVPVKQLETKGNINQSYTFDTFVVGPTNSLAYAAAQAVAEKPGLLYSPLFIYGDSGLGKTHLLHAVGNHIRLKNNKARIVYQSADRFVNEFINAIRFNKMTIFESKYKDLDVLLIDDIQFISNKEQTQEAFFHIFNSLYEARKQIVFSSDTLPKDIAGLAHRLRSRLDGGLVTDVQRPTLETKIAILKKKADLHNELLTDEVAHFIASKVLSNIRELEGLLIRVLAFASLTHQQVTLELAQKVLTRVVRDNQKQPEIDLPLVATKVAQHYKFSVNELRSTKRHKNITFARHVAMYLMKKLTDASLSEIGAFWCRRDHSTVIHALEKIEQHTKSDELFFQELTRLEQSVLG